MKAGNRLPGWDKQVVNRIAKDQYGGLAEMFEAHGWTTDGRVISQIAPTKAMQTYGSVEAFERAHMFGRSGNALLDPQAAIMRDPPEVWLTSYYGFDPDVWGLVNFSSRADRDGFIRRSVPGALVVIYGTKALGNDQAGRILGVQQITHVVGHSRDFIEPSHWSEKQSHDPDRWNFGVKCVRAWKIPKAHRPLVEDFAPDTYSIASARSIGRRGKRMSHVDAMRLLSMPLIEWSVYGGQPVEILQPLPGLDVLVPSRAGPVSQSGYWVSEAEGPKHLYILQLEGNADAFLGYSAGGRRIVKVGFSHDPDIRCLAHNKALPKCAFSWRVDLSTSIEGREPFPTSEHAKAGEQAMKDLLQSDGKSLGGEFFLASSQSLARAWQVAIHAAENWKP